MAIQIKIKEPCHESWQNMTTTQNGKFCEACSKEVIDFTRLSSSSILNHVSQSESLCGRFYKHQLEQTYTTQKESSFWQWAILSLGLSAFIPQASQAQVAKQSNQIEVPTAISERNQNAARQNPMQDSITIQGKVLDNYGEDVIGATIRLQGTQIGTITDIDGKFSLTIPQNLVDQNTALVISFIGYENITMPIQDFLQQADKTIQFKHEASYLGDVVIAGGITTSHKRPSLWQRIQHWFQPKEKQKERKPSNHKEEDCPAPTKPQEDEVENAITSLNKSF